ncbi:hypothetical protein BDK51DRAFT_48851 [Blyttiomyces helicus]|uniref:Uncharacterized protein n=1 Tax=Blyttiomyces helicus TaxID=388810 RepID=A0A4V1IQ44_9FUNG|nr:hypothetical protein BDK51DRAFT_48851 [Blyttiomyces helicus]|eukprot:RKO85267.1 hypothetical protein BDK51DRAFT_48851 [Blyttiomyces helicus]
MKPVFAQGQATIALPTAKCESGCLSSYGKRGRSSSKLQGESTDIINPTTAPLQIIADGVQMAVHPRPQSETTPQTTRTPTMISPVKNFQYSVFGDQGRPDNGEESAQLLPNDGTFRASARVASEPAPCPRQLHAPLAPVATRTGERRLLLVFPALLRPRKGTTTILHSLLLQKLRLKLHLYPRSLATPNLSRLSPMLASSTMGGPIGGGPDRESERRQLLKQELQSDMQQFLKSQAQQNPRLRRLRDRAQDVVVSIVDPVINEHAGRRGGRGITATAAVLPPWGTDNADRGRQGPFSRPHLGLGDSRISVGSAKANLESEKGVEPRGRGPDCAVVQRLCARGDPTGSPDSNGHLVDSYAQIGRVRQLGEYSVVHFFQRHAIVPRPPVLLTSHYYHSAAVAKTTTSHRHRHVLPSQRGKTERY